MKIIQKNRARTREDVCGLIRELYQSENLSFSLAAISGRSVPHKHEKMEELYFVLRGKGQIRIGKESGEVQPGDLIPIPKGKYHHLEAGPGQTVEVVVVTHPGFDPADVIKKEA